MDLLVPAYQTNVIDVSIAKQHHTHITNGNVLQYDSTDQAPSSRILAPSGIVFQKHYSVIGMSKASEHFQFEVLILSGNISRQDAAAQPNCVKST